MSKKIFLDPLNLKVQFFYKMTNIYLKGILGKKFGCFFKFNVSNAISAIKAIDANRNGFINELLKLNYDNVKYIIVCDFNIVKNENELLERKKIKNIYIIPAFVGSGGFVAVALGLVTSSGALTAGGMLVSSLVDTLVSGLISLGVSYISSMLNKQASPPQQNIAIGGATAAIEAIGKSYIFSNRENLAQQATSIPIGYGLMKTSSKIISISINNYSTNTDINREFKNFQNSSIFLDYLTN